MDVLIDIIMKYSHVYDELST